MGLFGININIGANVIPFICGPLSPPIVQISLKHMVRKEPQRAVVMKLNPTELNDGGDVMHCYVSGDCTHSHCCKLYYIATIR